MKNIKNKLSFILLTFLTTIILTSVILFCLGGNKISLFASEKTAEKPTLSVTTDNVDVGIYRKTSVTLELTNNTGIACIRLQIEADPSLKYIGKLFGKVFEEGDILGDTIIVNTLYGENEYENGTIVQLNYEYPTDTEEDTFFPINVKILECFDADMRDVELVTVGGGINVLGDTVYEAPKDTPKYVYPDGSIDYEFHAMTAGKLPSGRTVRIDGEIDNVWNYTEEEQLTEINNSDTKATVRTLWENSKGHDYIDVLVSVEKSGAVTDSDYVTILFSLADKSIEEFGGGSYAINSKGECVYTTGWYQYLYLNYLQANGIEFAAKVTEENTYNVELRLRIPEAQDENSYITPIDVGGVTDFNIIVFNNGSTSNTIGWTYPYYGDIDTMGKVILGDTLKEKAPFIPGDVNGNGEVKGNDATLLLKYLAGWSVTIDENAADVNGDGKVKGNDATTLLKYLAGWDVELKSAETSGDKVTVCSAASFTNNTESGTIVLDSAIPAWGGNQSRAVRTKDGLFCAILVDSGNPNLRRFALYRIDTKKPELLGECDIAGTTACLCADGDGELYVFCLNTGDGITAAYGAPTVYRFVYGKKGYTKYVQPQSELWNHGGHNYENIAVDKSGNILVIVPEGGGGCTDNALLTAVFDTKAEKWSDMSRTPLDLFSAYPYILPQSDGTVTVVDQRDIYYEDAGYDDPTGTPHSRFLSNRVFIHSFDSAFRTELSRNTVYELAVTETQKTPQVISNYGGDVYTASNGDTFVIAYVSGSENADENGTFCYTYKSGSDYSSPDKIQKLSPSFAYYTLFESKSGRVYVARMYSGTSVLDVFELKQSGNFDVNHAVYSGTLTDETGNTLPPITYAGMTFASPRGGTPLSVYADLIYPAGNGTATEWVYVRLKIR